MTNKLTIQDYKESLNAAMLYAQSITEDAAAGSLMPSKQTNKLLLDLYTTHNVAIKDVAAELNTPPK